MPRRGMCFRSRASVRDWALTLPRGSFCKFYPLILSSGLTRSNRGVDCNAVQQDHEFMVSFLRQAQLQPVAFWARYVVHPNPMVHYRRWVNRRNLHAFIGQIVDDRYTSTAREEKTGGRQRPSIDY